MKEYDVIVIGAGVGLSIVFKALSRGLKVALIDKGNVGGTCLNVGCVPSKMLIYPADRISEIEEAGKLGIHAEITNIDFGSIMERMRRAIKNGRDIIKREIKNSENLDFYDKEGYFVEEYVMEINEEKIKGKKIFIVSGARPLIPPIKGLDKIEYLTNENVLQLEEKPESIIMIGGGYIAVEYGHFFAAMGTKVIMLEMGNTLISGEEPEISALFEKEMRKRMEIYTNTRVFEIRKSMRGFTALAKDIIAGEEKEFNAEKVMIAAGRKSNADLVKVENTGIETDEKNYIKVDDYLQTNKENIWALGDAIGKQMFTHAGDKEADIAWHNATSDEKIKMEFGTVPHAIFARPQVASVGLTQEKAGKGYDILVGRAKYSDIVSGDTMMEEDGFAKAIVEKDTGKILGFHIIGPYSPLLIQEVVNAMANKDNIKSIINSMHTFPTLSELIPETLKNLEHT